MALLIYAFGPGVAARVSMRPLPRHNERPRWTRGSLLLLGVLLSLILLAGCSSQMLEMCSPLPATSPVPRAYLPVNDLPPERGEPLIAPDQRTRIQTELLAARNRQATSATAAKPRQAP